MCRWVLCRAGFGTVLRLSVLLAVVGGCSVRAPMSPAVVASQPSLPAVEEPPLEWARDEPYFIVVSRSCRSLTLYRWGRWLRTYEQLAFGANDGDKLQAGDRRTPRGLYMIVGKRHHPRWSRFMLLDYPNTRDLDAWRHAVAEDAVSGGPGGEVGIHGTDKSRFNELGI